MNFQSYDNSLILEIVIFIMCCNLKIIQHIEFIPLFELNSYDPIPYCKYLHYLFLMQIEKAPVNMTIAVWIFF